MKYSPLVRNILQTAGISGAPETVREGQHSKISKIGTVQEV